MPRRITTDDIPPYIGASFCNGVAYKDELPPDILDKMSENLSRELNLLLHLPEYRADYEAIKADPGTIVLSPGKGA